MTLVEPTTSIKIGDVLQITDNTNGNECGLTNKNIDLMVTNIDNKDIFFNPSIEENISDIQFSNCSLTKYREVTDDEIEQYKYTCTNSLDSTTESCQTNDYYHQPATNTAISKCTKCPHKVILLYLISPRLSL